MSRGTCVASVKIHHDVSVRALVPITDQGLKKMLTRKAGFRCVACSHQTRAVEVVNNQLR